MSTTTEKLNRVKQTLGFFSMSVAWVVMNIFQSMYLVAMDGVADDSGVVIFWSGIFIAVAWVVFVIYPLHKLDHSRTLFRPTIFPLLTTFYAGITYAILVGGLFRSSDVVLMFLPLAVGTGFMFGACYALLIRTDKIVNLLYNRPFIKLFFFLSPAFFIFIFLWLLPNIVPTFIFRYTTDEVRMAIVRKTIPKYKVGDDFEPLKQSLPGYFDFFDNGEGNLTATMQDFAFVLQVHCHKIVRLEYGQSPLDIDVTISLQQQGSPCP